MIELNARWITTRSGNSLHCYLKSEADKVIAEKDKAIEELRNEADVYKAKYEQEYDIAVHNEKQLSAMRIEIRRQKYKRCLAMAERCSERFHHYVALSAFSPNKGAIPFYDKMLHKAYRWKYKWLELAEKFKEAK